MDGYLDYESIDEMRVLLLRLRQENETLRKRIAELEDELNDSKIPDSDNYSYDDWLENDYRYEDELWQSKNLSKSYKRLKTRKVVLR